MLSAIIPPERYLLSCLLQDYAGCADVIDQIAQHNLTERARDIFLGIQSSATSQHEIDAQRLCDYLEAIGWTYQQAYDAYRDLMGEPAFAQHAKSAIEKITEFANRNSLLSAAKTMHTELLQGATAIESAQPMKTLIDDIAIGNEKKAMRFTAKESVAAVIAEVKWRMQNDAPPGIPSGVGELDKIIGGLRPTDVYVIAGRPGTGKTALGLQIALHVATTKKVVYESLEMINTQLTLRAASALCGLPSSVLETGTGMSMTQMQNYFDKMAEIAKLNLSIFEGCRTTSQSIRAHLLSESRRGKVDLLVVDYLQLINGEHKSGKARHEIVADISRDLKSIAMEMRIPVIALSQLSRDSEKENRPPRLSDLRESGALEQDASVIIFTHADSFFVEKNRHGQTAREIPVIFVKQFTRFDYDPMHAAKKIAQAEKIKKILPHKQNESNFSGWKG